MKRFPSIKKNEEFQYIYKNGNFSKDKNFIMYRMERNDASVRIGISCSKRVGNSVVRHTLTRKVREIFRNTALIKKGTDIIIIIRKNASEESFKGLNESFLKLLKKMDLVEN